MLYFFELFVENGGSFFILLIGEKIKIHYQKLVIFFIMTKLSFKFYNDKTVI